jgi:chromosomal replication initiation ATPase DnaA
VDEAYEERILGSGDFVEQLRMRQELAQKFPASIGIREVIDKVCFRFDVDPDELRLKTRAPRIAEVRSIVCYLAVRHLGHSGVAVGRHLGLGRAGVSVAAGRGEKLVKTIRHYLA